jgi:hypothetical protein
MGTYAANLAGVFRRRSGTSEVYAEPDRFFAATYLTQGLRDLLHDTLRVLAGGDGARVLQLRTPFGGGKTHTLVALLHLARDRPGALRGSLEVAELPDPGPVRVAVLSGEELDPLSPMAATGTSTRTLWGELAAQLGRYELVAEHDHTGAAPGGQVLRQVLGEGAVLVLLDEVLVYVEKAMAVGREQSTAGRQAMLFVQALTEVVNSHPHAAMVYSLQASVGEAVGAEGLLTSLDHLVSRVDAKREPVSGDEVMRVVQRRLFADTGDPALHQEVARTYAGLLRRQLEGQAETDQGRREAAHEARLLEERIVTSYPFHPALLDLMYHRWGALPSYQRTRGALQFLASTVHALWQAGSTAPLIGPGDVDLSDEATRGAFFSQVGERERYSSVLAGDIIDPTAGAKTVDRALGADSLAIRHLTVGTRVATAIMLFSFGTREGEDRGVLESDLITGVLVPGLDRNIVVAALHDLRDEELFLHYTGRRYRFEPTPNLTKLLREEANKYSPGEVIERVREELEEQLRGAHNVAVWPDGPGGIGDGKAAFTVAYLHPDWSEQRSPPAELIERAGGSHRRYRNALALVEPDPAQFDRARQATRLLLGAESLLRQHTKHGFSPEQVEELQEKEGAARRDAAVAVGRAYARVVVPVKDRSGGQAYRLESIDLRNLLTAGRSLHERVVEALSQRVFGSITTDKLVALAGLGPDRPAVSCADLVDWFYSYFEFTKLWHHKAIAEAISNTVRASRAGYVVGLIRADGRLDVRDPRQVRLGEMLPSDEIDLSADAALLWADNAQRLLTPADQPDPADDHPVETTAVASSPSSRDGAADPAPSQPPAAAAPQTPPAEGREPVRRVELAALVGRKGLFGLGRSLSWLREQAGDVSVEIRITATSAGEGFDRIALQNGFVEPIEEGNAQISELRQE